MFQQISDFLTNGVAAVIYWTTLFLDKTGMAGLLIATFIAYTAVRLLLTPLIGQAGSDTASAMYGKTKLGWKNRVQHRRNENYNPHQKK